MKIDITQLGEPKTLPLSLEEEIQYLYCEDTDCHDRGLPMPSIIVQKLGNNKYNFISDCCETFPIDTSNERVHVTVSPRDLGTEIAKLLGQIEVGQAIFAKSVYIAREYQHELYICDT